MLRLKNVAARVGRNLHIKQEDTYSTHSSRQWPPLHRDKEILLIY